VGESFYVPLVEGGMQMSLLLVCAIPEVVIVILILAVAIKNQFWPEW